MPESDTRTFLSSMFANEQMINSYSRGGIEIKSQDTYELFRFLQISNINIFFWRFQAECVSLSKDTRRLIHVHDICKVMGSVGEVKICTSCSLKGSETSFYRKWKKDC